MIRFKVDMFDHHDIYLQFDQMGGSHNWKIGGNIYSYGLIPAHEIWEAQAIPHTVDPMNLVTPPNQTKPKYWHSYFQSHGRYLLAFPNQVVHDAWMAFLVIRGNTEAYFGLLAL